MRQQMQQDAKQQQFRVQQQQLALTVSRLSPFETSIAKALSSRGQTLAAFSRLGKGRARRKVSQEQRTGSGSGRVSRQPATPSINPLLAALPVVE